MRFHGAVEPDFADVVVLRDEFAPNSRSSSEVHLLQVRLGLVRPPGYKRVKGPVLDPRIVAEICRHLADYDQEHLVTLCMHEDGTLAAIHEAGIGTTNQVGMTAALLLKVALLVGVPYVWLVHNHPSGRPALSSEDHEFYAAVSRAAECVGVMVMDSIVVSEFGWSSAETGDDQSWEQSADHDQEWRADPW